MIDFALIRCGGRFFDFIHIVEQYAHIAQPSYAGIGADCGQAVFQAREAEDALLRLIGLPVEVNLLIGTGGHAVAPATAAVLGYQYHAVLIPLVDGARGAGRNAGGIQAVIAGAWQVPHKEVVEFQGNVFGNVLEIVVLSGGFTSCQIVFPVGPPFDFHALLGNQGTGAGNGLMIFALGRNQCFIVIGPRFVVIIHFRLVRVVKELGQPCGLITGTKL